MKADIQAISINALNVPYLGLEQLFAIHNFLSKSLQLVIDWILFYFLQENPEAPDAETLLNGHMAKWQDIRKSWKQSAANNEKRYSESMKILTTMYEK